MHYGGGLGLPLRGYLPCRHRSPRRESSLSKHSVVSRIRQVSSNLEEIIDGAADKERSLHLADRFDVRL